MELTTEIGDVTFHIRKIPEHKCELLEGAVSSMDVVGGNGTFRRHWRHFKRLFLASQNSTMGREIFRSTAGIEKEQMRQTRNFAYIMHPFSDGRMYWETVMIVIYSMLFILIPMELIHFKYKEPISLLIIKFMCDFVSWIDIFLWFHSGYYSIKHNYKIEMKRSKITRNYAFGYFLIDLISSIPVSMIIHLTQSPTHHYFKLILLLKLGRILTYRSYIARFLKKLKFYDYSIQIVKVSVLYIICIIWSTAVIIYYRKSILADTYHDKGNQAFLFDFLYNSFYMLSQILLVGNLEATTDFEMILQAIIYSFAYILHFILLIKMLEIYQGHSRAKNRYDNLVLQLQQYFKLQELPEDLCQKIRRYIDFRYQEEIYCEDTVLDSLSPLLRQDIMGFICQNMVEKVHFFQGIPPPLIMSIVTKLRPRFYLPNDRILEAGSNAHSMYFIFIGTVAVFAPNGEEMCHLEDGEFFGEIALVCNRPRSASIIAVTDCELYALSRKDFFKAMEFYPDVCNAIRRKALDRLHTLNDFDPNVQIHYK